MPTSTQYRLSEMLNRKHRELYGPRLKIGFAGTSRPHHVATDRLFRESPRGIER